MYINKTSSYRLVMLAKMFISGWCQYFNLNPFYQLFWWRADIITRKIIIRSFLPVLLQNRAPFHVDSSEPLYGVSAQWAARFKKRHKYREKEIKPPRGSHPVRFSLLIQSREIPLCASNCCVTKPSRLLVLVLWPVTSYSVSAYMQCRSSDARGTCKFDPMMKIRRCEHAAVFFIHQHKSSLPSLKLTPLIPSERCCHLKSSRSRGHNVDPLHSIWLLVFVCLT